mmetsp:Transcript_84297/g.161158  ORF Transcript_84297/g.161158 Transcript_84297/m.161158 type:complete len:304 (-) Transcript_84297:56-967(-)
MKLSFLPPLVCLSMPGNAVPLLEAGLDAFGEEASSLFASCLLSSAVPCLCFPSLSYTYKVAFLTSCRLARHSSAGCLRKHARPSQTQNEPYPLSRQICLHVSKLSAFTQSASWPTKQSLPLKIMKSSFFAAGFFVAGSLAAVFAEAFGDLPAFGLFECFLLALATPACAGCLSDLLWLCSCGFLLFGLTGFAIGDLGSSTCDLSASVMLSSQFSLVSSWRGANSSLITTESASTAGSATWLSSTFSDGDGSASLGPLPAFCDSAWLGLSSSASAAIVPSTSATISLSRPRHWQLCETPITGSD